MALNTNPVGSAGAAIYRLVVEAENRLMDRRSDVRLPFFRSASIDMRDGRQYSAFTRDISSFGVGLIHNMELVPGEFDLRISSARDYWVRVRTRIEWCKSAGEGWYISGGVFVGTAVVD